nr:acyl-CoA thioesterase [Candidatus Krumholzibacteria bacterium]
MTECPREPAIRVLMMPRDTNYHGTIFGGIILSHIDQAGAVATLKQGCQRVVTVAMDQVEFHQPVHVGDLVSFYAEVIKVGRTSITVRVRVESDRRTATESLHVTSADMTFVNVDEQGRPIPVPEN